MSYILVQLAYAIGTSPPYNTGGSGYSTGAVVLGPEGGPNTDVTDIFLHDPGPGTFTYAVQAMRFSDGTTTEAQIFRRSMCAIILQR